MNRKIYTVIDFIKDNLSDKAQLDAFISKAEKTTVKELAMSYSVKADFMRNVLKKLNVTPLHRAGGKKRFSLTEKLGRDFVAKQTVDDLVTITGYSKNYIKFLLRSEGYLPVTFHSKETKFAAGTSLHDIYYNMLKRCYKKENKHYRHYGGRGVKVCEEWKKSCRNFYKWAEESGYKKGLTLERIDVNKDYSPDNCCWIPYKRQAYNKTNSIFIVYKGERKCLGEWATVLGINYDTLFDRIFKFHWEIDKAFETIPIDIVKSRQKISPKI